MAPIVSFIGWHNSGKTTLATSVVSHLKRMGYRVAVIKSTDKKDIAFDACGTDSYKHRQAGADSVMLVAPDQTVLQTASSNITLVTRAHRYFPEADIVIAEGFKHERNVAKIEVVRDPEQVLRKEVTGVIGVATDLDITADYIFRLNEGEEIALFIEKRFLSEQYRYRNERTSLLINGRKIPLKEFIQESLAGTIEGYVKTLKINVEIEEIELRIKF